MSFASVRVSMIPNIPMRRCTTGHDQVFRSTCSFGVELLAVCAQRSAIDCRAVGAAHIPQLPAGGAPPEFAVLLRHRRVFDVNPARLRAADREHGLEPWRAVKSPSRCRTTGDHQAQQVRRSLLHPNVGLRAHAQRAC